MKNMHAPFPSILGVSRGDPWSVLTYSGVPYHLFHALKDLGALVGAVSCIDTRPHFIRRGLSRMKGQLRMPGLATSSIPSRIMGDWMIGERWSRKHHRSLFQMRHLRQCCAAFHRLERRAPAHQGVFQTGTQVMPASRETHLYTYTDMTVPQAADYGVFGFGGINGRRLAEAVEVQRLVFERSTLVFANTEWAADSVVEDLGIRSSRVRVLTPGASMADPGGVHREPTGCHVLFVGRQWEAKGGPLLLASFRELRRHVPDARLTIVGCMPDVEDCAGVEVLGLLRKDVPEEAALLDNCYRSATIFCMPSPFETTGIVYLEAQLYGLPVVMFGGDGRTHEVFPPDTAVILEERNPEALTAALLKLASSPGLCSEMGSRGRANVLSRYTWKIAAQKALEEIRASEVGCSTE